MYTPLFFIFFLFNRAILPELLHVTPGYPKVNLWQLSEHRLDVLTVRPLLCELTVLLKPPS